MDIENKLDDDFIFYLEFANSFLNNFEDRVHTDLCRAWLYKLCGKQYSDIESKRCRNIYLSNLVLCMQEGRLSNVFLMSPTEVDISNAMEVFGHLPPTVTEPDWLQEIADAPDDDEDGEIRDGRTYLATRTLPNGEGAFAYLAVTLAEEEPKWLGGGEGVFEEQMKHKYNVHVPPVSEMERILLRRKNPAERERVLAFYDSLIQNINKELEEEIKPEENQTVTGLLVQLADDLKRKNEYDAFELMSENKKRIELLLMLHDRIYARRQKIAKREEVLDDIEHKTLPPSFFSASLEEADKVELPAHMWEQAINKTPKKKNLELLFDNYPNLLIEKFLDLLANEKEEIAMRLQKRHENIASQMRKELRQEGEKGKMKSSDVEDTLNQAKPILDDIKKAYEKQLKHAQQVKAAKKNLVSTDQTELYEQLRAALYDTQKSVEEEAEKGRQLAAQINSVNAQTELYQQANTESIRKTEEANIAIMKNIKRLRAAVKQYETRVQQIKEMTSGRGQSAFII